jgi:hypothetical protein
MRSNGLAGILILSLAVNAAVLGTLGYHYFITQPKIVPRPCGSTGDGHFYQALGLSDAQLEKMEPLAQKFHHLMAEMKASMERKKGLLIDLLQSGDDPDRIIALRREMTSIQDRIQDEVISHIADIQTVLNSKQQEHFFMLMRQSMTCTEPSLSSSTGGSK